MILSGMRGIEKQVTHEAARSILIIGIARPGTGRGENDDREAAHRIVESGASKTSRNS